MPNEPALPDDRGTRAPSSTQGAAPSMPDAAPARDTRGDAAAPVVSDDRPVDIGALEQAGLTDEEIALYRRRIAEGFYNSEAVAAEVARRMLRNRDR